MLVCVERHPCEGWHRRYRIWPDLLETSYEAYAEPVKTICKHSVLGAEETV